MVGIYHRFIAFTGWHHLSIDCATDPRLTELLIQELVSMTDRRLTFQILSHLPLIPNIFRFHIQLEKGFLFLEFHAFTLLAKHSHFTRNVLL